ncbi:MAG: universal stress protein [Polyangiaceae bacterium]|jgi:universal stress protein A
MSVDEGSEPSALDGTDRGEVVIILAALDTSALGTEVVELGARLARRAWQHAQLHLLHVFRSARFDRRAQAGVDTEALLADAQSYLNHYVRRARGLFPGAVTGHLAQGDPAVEIVARARSLAADWLLVGTQDPLGLERFLLGSVAQKVAKSAPCSVVVVRRKQTPHVKVQQAK